MARRWWNENGNLKERKKKMQMSWFRGWGWGRGKREKVKWGRETYVCKGYEYYPAFPKLSFLTLPMLCCNWIPGSHCLLSSTHHRFGENPNPILDPVSQTCIVRPVCWFVPTEIFLLSGAAFRFLFRFCGLIDVVVESLLSGVPGVVHASCFSGGIWFGLSELIGWRCLA